MPLRKVFANALFTARSRPFSKLSSSPTRLPKAGWPVRYMLVAQSETPEEVMNAPSDWVQVGRRRKRAPNSGALRRFVREGGVEPPRPFGHWHLKPARLPIPPLARFAASGDAAISTCRGYHGG